MNDVRDYYNTHFEEEHDRLGYHGFELPVTLHFIKKYLPPGSEIFDTACGTGHYARELLDSGYRIGLNDISDVNTENVRKEFGSDERVLFIDRSDALESRRWRTREWDAVLILGPLYHLIAREKRLRLLKTAERNLKPGGLVFASFMTRTGALVYGIKNNPKGILYPDGAEKLWKTGSDDRFVEATEYFTGAYFSNPSEIAPMLEEANLEPLHLAGAEGVFGERFDLFHQLDGTLKEAWLAFVINHCEEKEMVFNSKHLLSVSAKKVRK